MGLSNSLRIGYNGVETAYLIKEIFACGFVKVFYTRLAVALEVRIELEAYFGSIEHTN